MTDQQHPIAAEASPTAPPIPVAGEVGELVAELRMMASQAAEACQFTDAESLSSAADLLERQAAPVPVPVNERLPEEGDLHPTEQWCWTCGQDCCAWHRVTRHFDAWSYWLPFTALPLPAGRWRDG